MGEAMISGAAGGSGSKIYRWKRYGVNETTVYTWNRWNAVTTTTYKWNKWSTKTEYEVVYGDSVTRTLSSFGNRTYTSYQITSDGSIRLNGNTYEADSGAVGRYTMLSYIDHAEYIKLTERDTSIDGKHTANGITEYFYGYKGLLMSTEQVLVKGTTSYGQVTASYSWAYPSNGVSGSYWYESVGSSTSTSKGSTKYDDVSSTSSTAYPNGSWSGSYWYDSMSSHTNYSMGAYKDMVYSTARNQYPDNGHNNSYWYVFDGES